MTRAVLARMFSGILFYFQFCYHYYYFTFKFSKYVGACNISPPFIIIISCSR